MVKIFKNLDEDVHIELLKSWIETMMEHRFIEVTFLDHGWEIPEAYQPLRLKVAKQAKILHSQFLQRNNVREAQRKLGTEYVIAVAKASDLSIDSRINESLGEVHLLQQNIRQVST